MNNMKMDIKKWWAYTRNGYFTVQDVPNPDEA